MISKPGDITNFFPHLIELVGNINDRKRAFVGFFEFLNRSTFVGVKFQFDSDTGILLLEGHSNPGEEHMVEDLLQDIQSTFDSQ